MTTITRRPVAFEIPAAEFDTVREELADEYINLVVVEDLDRIAW